MFQGWGQSRQAQLKGGELGVLSGLTMRWRSNMIGDWTPASRDEQAQKHFKKRESWRSKRGPFR